MLVPGSTTLGLRGIDVGFVVGAVPWGWIMLAAGAVGAIGLFGDATLAVAAGFVGTVAAVANAATLGRHDNLVLIPPLVELPHPQVSLAWGSFFVLASSLVVLVCAATLRNRLAP
jgi:hypothetical protein